MSNFMDGVLSGINKAVGVSKQTPWWCCDQCGETFEQEDMEPTCPKCNKGRVFKGSTKQYAVNLATNSAKKRMGLKPDQPTETPAVTSEEPMVVTSPVETQTTEATVTAEVTPTPVTNPVKTVAEIAKEKIAQQKAELQARLKELGVPFNGKLGVKKLQELVNQAEREAKAPTQTPAGDNGSSEQRPTQLRDDSKTAKEPKSGISGAADQELPAADQVEQRTDTVSTDESWSNPERNPEPTILNEEVKIVTPEPTITTPEKVEVPEISKSKAEREAAIAEFIKKFNLNELSATIVGTAKVQTHGFTIWKDGLPIFRFLEPHEDVKDFNADYAKARALQPACRIDMVQCNQVSNTDLLKCIFNGDLLAGLNNGNGTVSARRGSIVKIGALKTQKGNLRFVVLGIEEE